MIWHISLVMHACQTENSIKKKNQSCLFISVLPCPCDNEGLSVKRVLFKPIHIRLHITSMSNIIYISIYNWCSKHSSRPHVFLNMISTNINPTGRNVATIITQWSTLVITEDLQCALTNSPQWAGKKLLNQLFAKEACISLSQRFTI